MADQHTLDLTVDRDLSSVPVALTDDLLRGLSEHALTVEDARGDWQIAIVFIDNDRMVALHRDFMGLDSPTDIMTFPYGNDQPGGDIAICVPVAAKHAAAFGVTLDWELCFLVLHGILHLTGWDDATDADRTTMLDRQREILETWPLFSLLGKEN